MIAQRNCLKHWELMINRYYFFTSEHHPKGKYNEVHPCRIVRTRWREQGWYLNSFYRVSRFAGIKLGRVSLGLVTGYRRYRIPYVAYHWEGGFTLPVVLVSWITGSKLKYIRCTYGDRKLKTSLKMIWRKWIKDA